MSAGKLCHRVVATATPEETVAVAARRMSRNDVGALVVVEGGGSNRPVGVMTDRDITIRCVAVGVDPERTPIATVMSQPVLSVGQDTEIEDALRSMTKNGVRRLVVTGPGDHLCGILTLDDVLELIAREVASIRLVLERQRPVVPA